MRTAQILVYITFYINLNLNRFKIIYKNIFQGKVKTLLNVNVSILNEIDICNSPYGHYSVRIHDIKKENYTILAPIMRSVSSEFGNLKTIDIMGKTYRIKLYLGADLKMVLILYGIF